MFKIEEYKISSYKTGYDWEHAHPMLEFKTYKEAGLEIDRISQWDIKNSTIQTKYHYQK